MTYGTILLAALVAIFVLVGVAKVIDAPALVAEFERFGYPRWFRRATGSLEVGGAALLLGGLAVDELAVAGAAVLLAVMTGAIATHLRLRDPVTKLAPPFVLAGLLVSALVVVG